MRSGRAQPERTRFGARHLLALEPRMMFDAAAAATTASVGAAAVADRQAQTHVAALPDAAHEMPDRHAATMGFTDARAAAPDTADTGTAAHDVIFIDTAVSDYRRLADEWAGRGTVVLIDSTRDGLDQVRAALAGQQEIGAIHLVSHGSEGTIWLGTTKIDTAAIQGSLAASLGAVGRSLAEGGDILIYGCDFAEGEAGATALDAFARATGADVAASTDLTGYAARGGDWQLEAERGRIDARTLDGGDWQGLLAPIAIAVQPDTLTVRDANGVVVASGATGFTNANRSADVGAGASATWAGAATYAGRTVDLRATVVSLSAGDAVRFDRPTAASDDAGFLLRNVAGTTTGTSSTQIRWELIDAVTGTPLSADVRFTIADIDGVAGNTHTRESLVVATDNLSYFTRERISDIQFTATLAAIDASGTQNELASPPTTISAASFDWTNVAGFAITYNLNRAGSTQAAFYHDGDADFIYNDPVYTSIPRLDLDADDSSATGTGAAFTYTENDAPLRIVDQDLSVANPAGSVTRATLVLTNAKPGDVLAIGTLPAGITGTVDTATAGRIVVSLTGDASAATYEAAIKAVTFRNALDNPDTTTRTVDVAFSNATLTSAVATSRIDVVAVNDAPTAVADAATVAEDRSTVVAVLANGTDPEGDALSVTAASALHGSVVRNPDGTLGYTPDADYNGADTISYTIADGHGGTASGSVAVRVVPQADTPVTTVPGAQTLNEDATLTFSTANGNALSITSPDGGLQQVTLTVTQGVFTLGGTTGLTFTAGDGSADATMTFTGTVADINAALQSAVYAPGADRNGAAQLAIATTRVAVDGEDFQNGDMERPFVPSNQFRTVDEAQVPGWETTATDGQIEVWGNGYNGVAAYDGRQFFEINANEAASLYQEFRSTAGSPVTIGFAHRGRLGTDTMRLTATDLGADGVFGTADDVVLAQQDYANGNTAWGTYSQQLTAAASGDRIRVDFRSVSTSSGDPLVGNFLDAVTITQNTVPATTSGTVAIAIAPVADIVADGATTAEDTGVTFTPLANDGFADPARAITAVDGRAIVRGGGAIAVANGSVALDAASRFVFTPAANFNGTTSFTYTVSAGGSTETATETITVTPVDDVPVAVGTLPPRTAADRAIVSFATAPGFADADGDALTYTATGLPAGLTIDAATGVISGTLGRSASQAGGGVYAVTVTAREAGGAAVSQSFSLTATNPAPIAVDDGATTAEDRAVTIAVLANDGDPDGDPLTVIAATADHGSVVRNPDGTLTYTPNRDFNGSDVIRYTIADGEGGTAAATVAVTVTPVDDVPVAGPPLAARSTRDGATVAYPTAAGFVDVDGDALTYSATGLPAGLSIDPATGVVAGIVDRSASQPNGGAYVVVVTARDAAGGTATQRFAIAVANLAPSASDDRATTAENMPVTIAVLTNDSDPDADPLAVIAAAANHGSVARNADGTLTYTPDTGYVGGDDITYTITDREGGTAVAHVAITVTNVPPASRAVPAQSALDGQPLELPLGPYFTAPAGAALTYAATALPPGLTIDPATGTITGTIDRSASQTANGRYASVVSADDGRGGRTETAIAWAVTDPAPQARNDTATTREDVPVTIAPLANDSDPDRDPLTIVAATAAHGVVAINPDGTIDYRPDADFAGNDTILYTVDDGQGGRSSATISVAIAAVNDAPTTTGLAPRDTADAASVAVPTAPAFADRDGDGLTYSATGLPAGLSIDPASGTITGTIVPGGANGGPAGDGAYQIVVTATDPAGAAVDARFTWFVRQVPPIANDDIAITAEDRAVTVAVLANDADPNNDPLTIVAATGTHGTVAIDGAAISFTPDADFAGIALVTYTIDDGHGGRATATVTITVTAVDDAPEVSPRLAPGGDPFVVRSADGQADILVDAGMFFTDRDGDPLTFAVTGLPPGLALDPATGRITGTLDRAASLVDGGAYVVTLTARDPDGAAATGSFRWFVANPAPTALVDRAATTEDRSVTIPVLANDVDPDADPLTVAAAQAAHGSVAIAADRTLTYTPDADFNGTDTILYTIDDGNGGHATAAVIVTVAAVGDAPEVVAPLPAMTARDGDPVRIAAGPAFADRDGDALAFTATGLPAGLTIDPATGTITGTLARNAASGAPGEVYTVVVTATDPGGARIASTFAIAVANPAPVAVTDTARTDEDQPVRIAVLANDGDPDGDPLRITAASARHGSVAIGADGSIAYQPDASFSGSDTIVYTIDDGDGGTATATVAVTVDPINHAPVAATPGVPVRAIGGAPVRIAPLTGVVDPDGDAVRLTGATVSIGTVAVQGDGTLLYTPALGFVGTATITYTVTDDRGGTTTGTLLVRVADGRTADVAALLRFGKVTYRGVDRADVAVGRDDGAMRTSLSILDAVDAIRELRGTTDLSTGSPMIAAVEGIRSLRSIGDGAVTGHAIGDEVARLARIVDFRDGAARLFDPRWGDFLVAGQTGFSAASDAAAGIMIETVVRDHAIYVEVRDVAASGTATIRSVALVLPGGGAVPAWIRVDPRGLAIVERPADADEIHLVVRVTRADGHVTATPIVIQGATGEIELDRAEPRHPARAAVPTLDHSLTHPRDTAAAAAARLARSFQP